MTAVNYLTLNNGVVLFSDTAAYDPEMRITRFRSKVRTPEGGKLGIITSGSTLLGDKLVADLEVRAGGVLTFDRMVENLPGCVRDMNEWLDTIGYDRSGVTRARVAVVFAGWSDERQEWLGAYAYSWKMIPAYQEGHAVFSFQHMWPVLEIEGDGRLLTDLELTENLRTLGSAEFARRVLNLQRRTVLVFDKDAGAMADCVIGGEAELVTIMHEQTTRKVVERWNDALGDDQDALRARVKAEPLPRFLVEKSPAERRQEERQKAKIEVLNSSLSRARRRRMAREERRAA